MTVIGPWFEYLDTSDKKKLELDGDKGGTRHLRRPGFYAQIQHLTRKFSEILSRSYNILSSKVFDQDLSFERTNIFVGKLKLAFELNS